MKHINAKQFSNIPTWQADKAVRQAKKQAKQFKQYRNAKRSVWAMDGVE